MKLYTEEQLETAILETFFDCKITTHKRYKSYERIESDILKQLTPIELPSDEEIGYYADYAFPYAEKLGGQTYAAHKALKIGAKWVIEKIKQQGK